MKKKGTTYYWCTKCTPPCYRKHSVDKHDEWAKKQKSNTSNNQSSSSKKSLSNQSNLAAEGEEGEQKTEEWPSFNAAAYETKEDDFITMTGMMQVALEWLQSLLFTLILTCNSLLFAQICDKIFYGFAFERKE